MVFISEDQKKINDLYSELQDLKKGKKILENAMHKCFYNKELHHNLYLKYEKQIEKINYVKKELLKEKIKYEKSKAK